MGFLDSIFTLAKYRRSESRLALSDTEAQTRTQYVLRPTPEPLRTNQWQGTGYGRLDFQPGGDIPTTGAPLIVRDTTVQPSGVSGPQRGYLAEDQLLAAANVVAPGQ